MDAVFVIRQRQERKVEGNQALYCGIIDLEDATDVVPRDIVCWALLNKEKIVRVVAKMDRGTNSSVLTKNELSGPFSVNAGLIKG